MIRFNYKCAYLSCVICMMLSSTITNLGNAAVHDPAYDLLKSSSYVLDFISF